MDGLERWVWTLGHSLWEGATAAAVLWGVLCAVPVKWARVRYAAALAGMAVLLFAMGVTWSLLGAPEFTQRFWKAQGGAAVVSAKGQAEPAVRVDPAMNVPVMQGEAAAVAFPWAMALGGVWIVGAAGMLVRTARGWRQAQGLAKEGRVVELAVLRELVEKMGMRPVRAVVSVAYRVPAVVGAWSPVVLVPAAIVAEMSPEQLRMILAHELAHIRRWDFLVNVVQGVVESLLFFNPAVWWMSRQIRVEREACCDAVAASVTGDAEGMARALSAVAERLVLPDVGSGAVLAVSGSRGTGLVERVRRLLVPERRAAIGFPFQTTLAGFGVAALILVMLGGAAQLTVSAAEKMLTPQERVEKIAALEKQIGPQASYEAEQGPAKYLLSGSVRMRDGRPVPKGLWVWGFNESPHTMATLEFKVDKTGHFSQLVKGEKVCVWTEAKGYAKAYSDFLHVDAEGKFPPVELVVDEGFEGSVAVVGEDGKPVAGARMTLMFPMDGEGNGGMNGGPYTADEEGVIAIEHADARPARATVEAAGHQGEQVKIQLDADKAVVVKLRSARTTEGMIVDAGTKKPIAGATVRLVERHGFADRTFQPYEEGSPPPTVATTDDAGHFRLGDLRDGARYSYWLAAPGHGSSFVKGVEAGQSGLVWGLGARRSMEVVIKADAGQMPEEVGVSGSIALESINQGYRRNLPVTREGEEGRVEVDDLLPGEAWLEVGDKRVRFDETTASPVVVDLRKGKQAPQAMRRVLVKLHWPQGGPEPTGKLRINYLKPEQPGSYWPEEVAIKNGGAFVDVPVPTKMGYEQVSLVGYWVKGQAEIEVPAGEGAFVVDAEAHPAGAVFGKVRGADGQLLTHYFSVFLQTVKEAPHVLNGGGVPQNFDNNEGNGAYLLSPIPLGGRYRLVVSAGAAHVVSEELVVDEAHPIRELNLQFAEGVTLAGTVRGPGGKGVSGAMLQLALVTGSGFFSSGAQADQAGHFEFAHVNPAAGSYHLEIKPTGETCGKIIENVPLGVAPVDITLHAGVRTKIRLMDAATGKPIADTHVTLYPRTVFGIEYPQTIDAGTTGASGELEVMGLEAIDYSVQAYEAYPVDAKIQRDANGQVISITYPGGSTYPVVRGGEPGVKEIRLLSVRR